MPRGKAWILKDKQNKHEEYTGGWALNILKCPQKIFFFIFLFTFHFYIKKQSDFWRAKCWRKTWQLSSFYFRSVLWCNPLEATRQTGCTSPSWLLSPLRFPRFTFSFKLDCVWDSLKNVCGLLQRMPKMSRPLCFHSAELLVVVLKESLGSGSHLLPPFFLSQSWVCILKTWQDSRVLLCCCIMSSFFFFFFFVCVWSRLKSVGGAHNFPSGLNTKHRNVTGWYHRQ